MTATQGSAHTAELDGPYLQIAALCEHVLEERDNVLSIIRIVDRITLSTSDPRAPAAMPPVPVNVRLVIALKSGFARGRFDVKIGVVAPSTHVLAELSLPVLLEGEERGANIVMPVSFSAEEEGLYWFEVRLGDRLLTRVPLRLIYSRVSMGSPPETAG